MIPGKQTHPQIVLLPVRFVRKTKEHIIKCRTYYWQLSARAVISWLFARSTYYNGTSRQEISEASQYECRKYFLRCSSNWWLLQEKRPNIQTSSNQRPGLKHCDTDCAQITPRVCNYYVQVVKGEHVLLLVRDTNNLWWKLHCISWSPTCTAQVTARPLRTLFTPSPTPNSLRSHWMIRL